MVIFGYAKQFQYAGDGTLYIKVRIPLIHGPYSQREYRGKQIRNYVADADLPWCMSLLLPRLPSEGDVVALTPLDEGNVDFVVIGLTGGSYTTGVQLPVQR